MSEFNKYSYNLSLKVLKALGGDVDKEFESVDDIWNDINSVLDASGDGIQLEELYAHITENGTYVYEADPDTDGYVPVIIDVEVGGADNPIVEDVYNSFDNIGWDVDDVNSIFKMMYDDANNAEDYLYYIQDKITEAPENTFLQSLHSEWADKLIALPKMDIPSKIKLSNTFNGFNKLRYVPDSITINNAYCTNMFASTPNLLKAPQLYFTQADTMVNGLYINSGISGDVQFNCYNTSGYYRDIFSDCVNLKSVTFYNNEHITKQVTLQATFQGCYSLESVDGLYNFSNIADASMAFANCSNLVNLPAFSVKTNVEHCFEGCFNLVNFGGFINLGMDYEVFTQGCFNTCDNLSAQSYRNVINNLYDLTTLDGYKEQTLWLNMHAMDLYDEGQLTDDDIAVATNKGWIIEYE